MILCNRDRQQVLYLLLTYLCSVKVNINSRIQVSHFEKAPPPEWTSTRFYTQLPLTQASPTVLTFQAIWKREWSNSLQADR